MSAADLARNLTIAEVDVAAGRIAAAAAQRFGKTRRPEVTYRNEVETTCPTRVPEMLSASTESSPSTYREKPRQDSCSPAAMRFTRMNSTIERMVSGRGRSTNVQNLLPR